MASTLATISSDRLDRIFEQLGASGRKALVVYVTAGYPDRARSLELLRGLGEAGADVVEVGVPFSDPIADGPVIQESSQQALAAGMTFRGVLDLVAEAQLKTPSVLFTYLNPLMSAGRDAVKLSKQAGFDGLLVTDLPLGADPRMEEQLGSGGLAFIRLVAPTTPVERMREISGSGSGFVYLISRLGVTGAQKGPAPELEETAARLRSVTSLPICVGFGISDGTQARAAAALADGVVVGSAVVRASGEGVEAALALTRSLRSALDS